MSKSLEALEELKDEIIPDYALEYDDEGYKDWVIELYQTIKQDLELKDKYLNELKRWGYPETPIHISKYKALEEENQKLK